MIRLASSCCRSRKSSVVIMNSVLAVDGLASLILSYAIPCPPPISSEHRRASDRDRDVFQLRRIQKAMSWVAALRTVNRRLRDVIDDPDSNTWFLTAMALQLDPPLQLYAGGTYKQVCMLLLAHQRETVGNSGDHGPPEVAFRRTACMMPLMPSWNPRKKHPNPERPPVQLPEATASNISKNAQALESFLRSVNFSVLMANDPQWHGSSYLRYKMFLHLKRTHPKTWLIPTADIEFCWLAHIFRTQVYWEDMASLGIDPGHSLLLGHGETATFKEAVKGTAALWEATFGPQFPYLPNSFSIEDWSLENAGGTNSQRHRRRQRTVRYRGQRTVQRELFRFFPVMGSCDATTSPRNLSLPDITLTPEEVQADLEWFPQLQRGLNEISRNMYDVQRGNRDVGKLYKTHLVPSYERFLNLCHRQQIHGVVAPPYVLDLIWHAHQADPVAYKRECMELFGREFWHHPWPNGLGVSSNLSSDFRCAWKRAYGSTIEEDWQLRLTGEEGPPFFRGGL